MTSVDWRTRPDVSVPPVEASRFLEAELPALLEERGIEAGRAVAQLGLPPLSVDLEGEQFTLAAEAGRLGLTRGTSEALVVSLNVPTWSDLLNDTVSTFGLVMSGRVTIQTGSSDDFVDWEPVLRCLFDGSPVYKPGTIAFGDRDGLPLNLKQSFKLNDDPDAIGHFLSQAGFLHLEGVFSEAEMDAVSRELDDAIAAAERDDGASWWAQTASGEWYPARILGFNLKSAALRSLLHSQRIAAIGSFTDDQFIQRNPDVGDSAEGLLKKVQVIEGISDVSWHKDCAMGGHSRHCCGLVVGISVTGAGPENGELGVIPGSHRANISPLGAEGLDLPRLPLPTRTGDVTVHCSCTLHMSRPPVSAERRVVYTGFQLAPRPGDEKRELTAEEVRRERARLNDQVREGQQRKVLSADGRGFDL